jgi:hypothetical protein
MPSTNGVTVNPLNQCCECGEDFASLRAFDEHILSKPSDPTFECTSVFELLRRGWEKDARGRWTSPTLTARAEQIREHYSEAA